MDSPSLRTHRVAGRPKIGLMSDTHGRAATAAWAARLLLRQGATILLHLGDIGSDGVIDALAGLATPDGQPVESRVVFGNTDHDWEALAAYAHSVGVAVDHPVGHLQFDDGDLAYLHGDDLDAIAEELSRQVRYLCFGHSHQHQDVRSGATRLINPGALFRARPRTVAVVDTATDSVSLLRVEDESGG